MMAHHVADVCDKLLDEILQSAQVQAGVSLSVSAIRLAPSHRSVQPELQLLDQLLELDLWLQLRHSYQALSWDPKGDKEQDRSQTLDLHNKSTTHPQIFHCDLHFSPDTNGENPLDVLQNLSVLLQKWATSSQQRRPPRYIVTAGRTMTFTSGCPFFFDHGDAGDAAHTHS